ncbi:MAG: Hpt domain-containing protein, partial [Minicystis sp.]
MNERRKALLARFRASSIERIRRIAGTLAALRDGSAEADAPRELGRELHTLKGESNMMGMTHVGAALHAAEGLLRGEETPGPEALILLEGAVERIGAGIQGMLPDEQAALEAIMAEIAALVEPKSGDPTTARSSAVALTRDEPRAPMPAAKREPSAAPLPRPEVTGEEASSMRAPSSTIAPEKIPERWVQIDARRVDDLCERITGFSADFRALSAQIAGLGRSGPAESGEALGHFRAALRVLGEEFDRCRARLEDITDVSWSLRLAPVEPTLGDLAQYARQLAAQQGKRLRVTVRAGGAAVERSLLDELWDPLVHLVRNAVDHGIELPEERGQKGTDAMLGLFAEPVGPNVVLTVLDDGRGIDPERVRAAACARGLLGEEAARTMSD